MNPLTMTQLVILLWSALILGPQTDRANGTRNLCSESFPSGIQRRLREEYPSWQIQKPENLSPRARGRWQSEKPLTCPGIAVGRFEKTTMSSYALLLVPVEHSDAGYRFLIFTQKSGETGYDGRLVDRLDGSGAANYFVRSVPISKFFDEASRRKFQAHEPEGVLLIDAAEKEYEVDVYFWSEGRYRHEPLDY